MRKILFLLGLLFITISQTKAQQYKYTYGSSYFRQTTKNKDTLFPTKQSGIITINPDFVSIDFEDFYYPEQEYKADRKMDTCCQISIDKVYKLNSTKEYILETRYKDNRLIEVRVKNFYTKKNSTERIFNDLKLK